MKLEFVYIFCIFLSQSPLSFPVHPLFYPPKFLSFFLILQKQFLLPKYSLMYGLLLQNDQLTKSYILLEHCLSLSQQLTIISAPWTDVGQCAQLLSLCWDFSGLASPRFCTCCHNSCELICVNAMLCPEDDVSA